MALLSCAVSTPHKRPCSELQAGNYTEIDLSPHNALWAGHIHNPTGTYPVVNSSNPALNTVNISCTTSGVASSAKITPTGWVATLFVPFRLVGHPLYTQEDIRRDVPPPAIWRANVRQSAIQLFEYH